ncbi:hypothetical protein PAEPH01_0517 [Pancytospora epiphaga]|nr:hypothetical protein PAEPH01_0517 [Pancytospora epiphaga]
MTWDGVVTNYHKQYFREIGLTDFVEAYIQLISNYIEDIPKYFFRISTCICLTR